MLLSRSLHGAAHVTPIILATLLSPDANALNLKLGECLPAAEMMKALGDEGQRSVIIADRVWWADENVKIGGLKPTVFTSNASGSLGYQIEGKESFTGAPTPPTEYCLVDSYTNIRLFNNSKDGETPASIAPKSGLSKIITNESMRRGLKPMMIAEKNSLTIVFSANPNKTKSVNGSIFEGGAGNNQAAGSAGEFAHADYSKNVDREKLPGTTWGR